MNAGNEIQELEIDQVGRDLLRLRTVREESVSRMARSLRRYGQLTPVVVALTKGGYEMVDGFKRLLALMELPGPRRLRCRVVRMSPRAAKVAMYSLNRVSSSLNDLEEALVVQSLYREDGLTQAEIGQALGHHKSWVCRRLRLVERLIPRAREEMRTGVLGTTAARSLARLSRGNQRLLLDAIVRTYLSTRDLARVVDLLREARSEAQRRAILLNPKGALRARVRPEDRIAGDLTPAGRSALKRIALLERVGMALAGYLETDFPAAPKDRELLLPWLRRLERTVRVLMPRLESARGRHSQARSSNGEPTWPTP